MIRCTEWLPNRGQFSRLAIISLGEFRQDVAKVYKILCGTKSGNRFVIVFSETRPKRHEMSPSSAG